MRRPSFRRAIKQIRDTLRFQGDLHLAVASVAAAQTLSESLLGAGDGQSLCTQREQIQYLGALLRLSHLRERFSHDYEKPEPPPRPTRAQLSQRRSVIEFLLEMDNPNATLGWLVGHLERQEREEQEVWNVKRRASQAA